MKKTELLAPAGSLEGLRAAIAAGADAVYLGASAFSARASAGFDDSALKEAIETAHLYGRRVYVAVNTLIKQREWPQLEALLEQLRSLRPDAVLVQDLGVLSQLKESIPSLQLHASTQMAVHNAVGARFLLDAGVDRVVAARECGLDSIRQMAQTGIEVEVFVHGALCVSVSGQCLLSSQIGGRSGNRGRCAQPCRLPYRYRDQEGALLSMRDINTLEALPQLLSNGVTSLKIEGRLKRIEYVTEVVSLYRRALDLAEAHKSLDDPEGYQERLGQIFSRGGFTCGHLLGAEDSGLIHPGRVSHEGIRIGSILSARRMGEIVLAEIRPEKTLHDGDGLQIRGETDQEIIYSGREVPAGQAASLRLRQMPARGDIVFRLADEAQLSRARTLAARTPEILFEADLLLAQGQPARLILQAGNARAAVSGDVPVPARSQPLSKESAGRYIGKTGGTPFRLWRLRVESGVPLFLSSASLNQLRRDGLRALERSLIERHQIPPARPMTLRKPLFPSAKPQRPGLYALVRNIEVYQALKSADLAALIYAPGDFRAGKLAETLRHLDADSIVALPPQMRDASLEEAFRLISAAGHRLMISNVSQLALPHSRPFLVGEGIPVWNARAARVMRELGAAGVCLSRELSGCEAQELEDDALEWILPVYGRASVMLLNHCPERVRRGLSAGRAGCALCDRGEGVKGRSLEDRFHASYPLLPTHFPDGCLITLFHHTALNLMDKAPQALSWLMDFSAESPQEALQTAGIYHALRSGESVPHGKPACGRFLEGVL